MGRTRVFLITALVLFHFTLVTLGVLHVGLPGRRLKKAQLLYSRVTGGGGSFGFFSPNVPREVDVEFDVERADFRVTHATLQEYYAPEVRTRLGNMIRMLGNNFQDDKRTRSIAAALAVNVWRKFPDARSVTLHASLFQLPPLREYQGPADVKLVPVYSATFRKTEAP